MITSKNLVRAIRLSQTKLTKTTFSKNIGHELGYGFNTLLSWENGQNDMPLQAFTLLVSHFKLDHLTIDELGAFCNAYKD